MLRRVAAQEHNIRILPQAAYRAWTFRLLVSHTADRLPAQLLDPLCTFRVPLFRLFCLCGTLDYPTRVPTTRQARHARSLPDVGEPVQAVQWVRRPQEKRKKNRLAGSQVVA
jgi:hypothetical protein